MKPFHFALLSIVAMLCGCSMLSLPDEPAPVASSRTYPDSREVVWRRIISISAEHSMFIRQVDSENGLITVDQVLPPSGGNTIMDWAVCGWDDKYVSTIVSDKVEVNYLVRQVAGETTVTVNSHFQVLRKPPLQKPEWVSCRSTRVLENRLLQSLYYDHST